VSGRYRIERLLGTGGMGAVYQAEHTHMHKRLAVKVLHPEMTRLPEVVARFEREAMAAAHIEHPNVAAATDFGKLEDGSFFLVLEYVEGRSLREAIDEGRVELGRACHIARQMASALGGAHALGIVHRDLKPENVMLVTRDGDADFVKVLDFGIAKVPMGAFTGGNKGSGEVLTQLGMVYGTPEYMAPEQALGQEVDVRADLYALGIILFEMITGKRPYEHASKVTLLGMHVTAPIPRMRERAPEADVPADLDAIVTRLLAKEATARYGDARELIDALDVVTMQLVDEGRIASARVPDSQAVAARGSRTGKRRSGADSAIALGPTSLAQPAASLVAGGLARAEAMASERLARALSSAPPWMTPRLIMVGGAGLAILFVYAVVVATSARGSSVPAAKAFVPSVLTRVMAPKTDDRLTEASAKVDRGDYSAAIDALLVLEKEDGDRADVHKLLERAYSATHDTRGALREAGLWLASDESAASDPKLQEDVRNAGLVHETQDDAFTLLESRMGTHGVDLVYDIAYGASGRQYPQAAARARRSLDVEDVRSRASPALMVLLDFRAAKTCDAKRALLDRARLNGDARMLSTLQPYTSTKGCGFLGISDCYPCLHKDSGLRDTLNALAEHAAP
jgi:eukaryotic-like serine/threonine-protein kinase